MGSKKMASLLQGAKVLNKNGDVEDLSKYTTVGLYFTASWCPPCRGFTPILNEAYKNAVANGKSVQIVFMSRDRDQARYDFDDQAKCQELKQKFNCNGIPYLVLLNADGSEKTRDGRNLVVSKGGDAFD